MKNTFSVTVQMKSVEQLANYIDAIGHLVESVTITTTPVETPMRAPTGKNLTQAETKKTPQRVSKVNEAILNAVQNGPATVKQLKEALESRNLSAGSLSTGIAALSRDGKLSRVAEGIYGLPGAQQQAA